MTGLAAPQGTEQDVTVGLVGPHALLERIVLAAGLPRSIGRDGATGPGRSAGDYRRRRVLVAAYRDELEAPERAARLADAVDALLFAGPVPLAYATRAGQLPCPAISLELAGGPLAAALVRASQAGIDAGRASFDSFSHAEVGQALADAGLPAAGPHVHAEPASPAALASYHARLWQLGLTSAAVTSLEEVARRLTASHVPAFLVQPSEQAIGTGLRTATLLAQVRALASAQLAVALVEVPALRDWTGNGAGPPRQAADETRLRVHAFLVREALQIGASVSPVSDHGFLVVATRSSLPSAAAGPPFAARARELLGIAFDVGVGTGRTEHEAEDAARRDLRQAWPQADGNAAAATGSPAPATRDAALAVGRAGPALAVGGAGPATGHRSVARLRPDTVSRVRSLETLARLARKLAADASPVVDAELTGQLLSVTPRTARRQLRALAEQGLALPLPPRRTPHPGRPRQAYRLVVEELDTRAAQ